METTIILTTLKIKSSYIENKEFIIANDYDIPDTIQWIISNDAVLRIKTFSIDHDIHIHKMRSNNVNFIELAKQNNSDNYGDAIHSQHILHFNNLPDIKEANLRLKDIGFTGEFRELFDTYIYWSPDAADYKTKSEP